MTDFVESMVAQLRQYSAEELARHGITLAPEKDWATELWADAIDELGLSGAARSIRDGKLDAGDKRAIELIRSRVTPKEANNA